MPHLDDPIREGKEEEKKYAPESAYRAGDQPPPTKKADVTPVESEAEEDSDSDDSSEEGPEFVRGPLNVKGQTPVPKKKAQTEDIPMLTESFMMPNSNKVEYVRYGDRSYMYPSSSGTKCIYMALYCFFNETQFYIDLAEHTMEGHDYSTMEALMAKKLIESIIPWTPE